ncbi:MAG: hypothetical protein CM15mP120_17740 [Pseudomonadota bacterium]|nr:MAG: hypothetical protein CM15mP120_17740 [Pseudomonadota bacterium]
MKSRQMCSTRRPCRYGTLSGIFVRAVFIETMAYFFLGMCTFIAISKDFNRIWALWGGSGGVLAITVPVNNLIFNTFLREGAWPGPASLKLI